MKTKIIQKNIVEKKVEIIADGLSKALSIDKLTTYNKINSAYASGGPELAIKTIEKSYLK